MDQSSSFTCAASQINSNDNSNHHHLPAAVLDPNKSTSCAIRTPRSAFYYPEKEDHFRQVDQERSFQMRIINSNTTIKKTISHPT
jgi:hypothetical protein